MTATQIQELSNQLTEGEFQRAVTIAALSTGRVSLLEAMQDIVKEKGAEK